MPVRSLNTSVFKWPTREQVTSALRSWAEQLATVHPELLRLGYFGSYARKDWGVGSDLDVVGVVTDAEQPFERRALSWEWPDLPVPVDLVIYTQAEWERIQAQDSRFARVLRQEVTWVYERAE